MGYKLYARITQILGDFMDIIYPHSNLWVEYYPPKYQKVRYIMFKNSQEMKAYVKDVLAAKNIQKLPRTLYNRMDDYQNAEFFGLSDKMDTYGKAIVSFCNALKANEHKSLPEAVKSDELPLETLKAKAVIHARRVRELADLRQRVNEKMAEVEHSLGKIPLAQREQFNRLLVDLQNAIAESAA